MFIMSLNQQYLNLHHEVLGYDPEEQDVPQSNKGLRKAISDLKTQKQRMYASDKFSEATDWLEEEDEDVFSMMVDMEENFNGDFDDEVSY